MRSRICSARTPKTPRDGRLADAALRVALFKSPSLSILFSFHSKRFFLRSDNLDLFVRGPDDALLRRSDAIASPDARDVVCAVAQYAVLPRNVRDLLAHARRRRRPLPS